MRPIVAAMLDFTRPRQYSSVKSAVGTACVADFDILVIGGGVNGAGIARDASGRGFSVLLCEQHDLAQATSSSSSKLIHGGLRYLEQYEFRLVREALREREVLLRAAPHIVEPLRFVLPHSGDLRPGWLIRLGLMLYDHMGARRRLPASERIDLRRSPVGRPLTKEVKVGFAYSDCRGDDSRLVVLNALDAFDRGAVVRPRTEVTAMAWEEGAWKVSLQPKGRNQAEVVSARAIVNAAGPWVGNAVTGAVSKPIRLVKGSHITVPKLYDGDHAYILQNTDRRIIFVIPYSGDMSLIGTTETEFEGDPNEARCSDAEIAYLCEAVNRWFEPGIEPHQVTWAYAGVRPLLDDGAGEASSVTRDYRIDLDTVQGQGPLLTVIGGKITTYRKLAEQAVERLQPVMGSGAGPWTARATLPGGDIPDADFDAFLVETKRQFFWLPGDVATRLAHAYGNRIDRVLGRAAQLEDLGEEFGAGLFEVEVDYLKKYEWAVSADDILWRRSKLGLQVDAAGKIRLSNWLSG